VAGRHCGAYSLPRGRRHRLGSGRASERAGFAPGDSLYLDLLSHRPSRRRLAAQALWAEHVVHRWRRRKPAVLGAVAAAVLALGIMGFRQRPLHMPVGDAVYRSFQLFALGGGNGVGTNAYLQVARFLGPCVVGYAAVGAIVTMYREQLNTFVARRLRGHVVVAGLGSAGARLAGAFAKDGWRVVAIERDPTSTAIAAARQRGVRVLVGDATDPNLLRAAGLPKALLAVALCGDDRTNIDVSEAARAASGRDRPGVLTAVAGFEDFDLWQAMKASALADRDQSRFRLELVNLRALATELLLSEHPPFQQEHPGRPHVIIVSDEPFVGSLLVGVLRRWVVADKAPGDFLYLRVLAPRRFLGELGKRVPELSEVPSCHLEIAGWDEETLEGAATAAPKVARAAEPTAAKNQAPGSASTAYVALDSETRSLSEALALRSRLVAGEHAAARQCPPVVVVVEDDSAGVAHAIRRGGATMEGVHAFGWLSRAARPAPFLEGTMTEVIARLGHIYHCEQQRALGRTEADDSSLAPWERLAEGLRESNRRWADSIPGKLSAVGCEAVHAPLMDPRAATFSFDEGEVEKLASLEHERWSADMKRIGYRRGPRDARHRPTIDVPFEELPPEDQEKDRAHIRSIPPVLARAGFKVQRAGPVGPRG
jgi:SAM-dependent methyltransferase